MIKYVVCGGWVQSQADGEEHYVSPERLIELYDVDPRECIKLRHMHSNHGFSQDFLVKLPWLTPKFDGNYKNS